MQKLDKKQIFIGTILGIILSILTIILLTRNIQPLSAQGQQSSKYTVFKTENKGFKFIQTKRILIGAYLEGENTKTNYGSASTRDIGKRFYLYERTGEVEGAPYPELSCDTNDYFVNCPDRFLESTSNFSTPPQYAGDTYRSISTKGIKTKQKVYTFKEPVIVKPIYKEEINFAPIFAQTPNELSFGNQVATKEYVDSKSGISIVEEDIQTGVKYAISGPICVEEYGVYIYERNGRFGEIYFTSMTGRSSAFRLELDNSNGWPWSISYDCGGWGVCDTIVQQISSGYYGGTQLAFLVAKWDWDKVSKVYISGSGLGFSEISYGDTKIIWKTGRKFLGNNYDCRRNWALEVRATSNYSSDEVFRYPSLPSNIVKSTSRLGSGKITRKYIGDSLISLIVNNKDETRTTVLIPLADVIQLCGDIDGCSFYIYKNFHNSNETYEIIGPMLLRYDISTKKWVSGYEERARYRAGTDGDGNTQHIWDPVNCYFTDGEYIDGQNKGDPYIGLGLLDWDPNENRYCYLVIKD